MMWEKILFEIGKAILNIGMTFVFKSVDKNDDGKISKEEVYNYIIDLVEKMYEKKEQKK